VKNAQPGAKEEEGGRVETQFIEFMDVILGRDASFFAEFGCDFD
jgi:hypothetical protein